MRPEVGRGEQEFVGHRVDTQHVPVSLSPWPTCPLPREAPVPDVPPMSMALRFRALMMFTMMELAEGL